MTQQDAVAADELKRFCQQLIFHGQLKYVRYFEVGSNVEIPNHRGSMLACGIPLRYADVDVMIYKTVRFSFSCHHRVPVEYSGKVLTVDTNNVHVGFVKLIARESGAEYQYDDLSNKLPEFTTRHGPADQFNGELAFEKDLKSNPLPDKIGASIKIPLQDNVHAIHSPYWPPEAYEWITRTRRHACPSKSVIKQVVRYGCDFVRVAHKLSCNRENKNEWRFSFSKAELIIIRSWTSSQRIAYRVLRLISKMHVRNIAQSSPSKETSMCTYYFKTLMLWACEERTEEFWAVHSLVHSIQQLLIEMTEWLTSKHCCNYFIPANNMMDHLVDTDVSWEVAALCDAAALSVSWLSTAIALCVRDESLAIGCTISSGLPIWLHRSILIHNRMFNKVDNFHNLGSTDFSSELQTALIQELVNIYRGLTCHRQAATSDTARAKCLQQAEGHFKAASALCHSTDRVLVDINDELFKIIGTLFAVHAAGDSSIIVQREINERGLSCGQSNALTTSKMTSTRSVFYSRCLKPMMKSTTESNEVVQLRIFIKSCYGLVEYLYRERLGHSPTVSVSWFIAKAYLANLYYTQRHYEAALETCNEVLAVYKHSSGNKRFAERTFPVLLTTQWAAVYDKELQALLGLCSLCRFVSNRTDARSVCLAVCPVEFVLYLKVRCAFHHSRRMLDRHGYDDYNDVLKSINELHSQILECTCYFRSFILRLAILETAYHCLFLRTLQGY